MPFALPIDSKCNTVLIHLLAQYLTPCDVHSCGVGTQHILFRVEFQPCFQCHLTEDCPTMINPPRITCLPSGHGPRLVSATIVVGKCCYGYAMLSTDHGRPVFTLTHWGRVTHICVSKLTIIGSDNGLSPGRRQAIIWANAGIFLIGPLGTNFSEILIEFHTFSFKKMHLKMSSGNGGHFVSASMC